MRTILFVLTLLLSSPAWAGDWVTCGTTSRTSSAMPAKSACYQDWSDDPKILDLTSCENADIFLYSDRNGSGVDSDATAAIYTCPASQSDVTTASAGCQPLKGGTTLNATDTEVFGLGADFIWADVLDAATQDPQLRVKCAQPSKP